MWNLWNVLVCSWGSTDGNGLAGGEENKFSCIRKDEQQLSRLISKRISEHEAGKHAQQLEEL